MQRVFLRHNPIMRLFIELRFANPTYLALLPSLYTDESHRPWEKRCFIFIPLPKLPINLLILNIFYSKDIFES
jgi:hypothetical protein